MSAPTATPAGATTKPIVLRPGGRHYARRFTGGITPTLAGSMNRAGGGRAWFEAQLAPSRLSDAGGTTVDGWYPSLTRTPQQVFQRQVDDVQGAWEVMYDLSRWTVARRIYSTRQVKELMVDFWSNLLHVPLMHDDSIFWRRDYDRTIRTYALDTFENLLLHSTTHPAMGLFLNNAISTKDAPNENLGRELLELHTVGLAYDEDDVKNSSRILTGYRVDVWWPSFRSFYDPKVHWTGKIEVLGFSHPNSSADGRAATTAYLKYLARHPATAKRLAERLCVRFVNDHPSPGLVDTVRKAYLGSGTAIKPTLRAMVEHPEFLASAGLKVRTPIEDYVASIRALGIRMGRPTSGDSFANAMYWQYRELGQAPYEWPAPNGFPQVNAAWTGAGRILNSLSTHRDLAAHWWPSKQASFRSVDDLLPATMPATLQEVVDHVSLLVLGQRPGADVSRGISTLLDKPLTRRVSRSEAHGYWFVIQIVSSLLDSPVHLHR